MRYQPLTASDLGRLHKWGVFPRRWRRLYIAQRGRCFLCGCSMGLTRAFIKRRADEATQEHVIPRSRGGAANPGNVALAHLGCNELKNDRLPHPCERLFALVVGASVVAMTPPGPDRGNGERSLKHWSGLAKSVWQA